MIAPADDLDRLMAVMECGFDPEYGEAWTRRQVEDALLTGNTHYRLIAQTGEKPCDDEPAVGFFLARHVVGEMELLLLAVNPEHRKRGFGNKLLAELLILAKSLGTQSVFLEMRRGNPAEQLYRKSGFKPVGIRPNYYRTLSGQRIDAITFALAGME